MDRRRFLKNSGWAASGGLIGPATGLISTSTPSVGQTEPPLTPQIGAPQREQFRLGITTDTRGGFGEFDPFKGFADVRDVGFRYVEQFGTSFCAVPSRPTNSPPPKAPVPNKVWPDGYVFVPPKKPRPPREVFYPDRWEALQHRMYEIGVQFTAITGGEGGQPTDFSNPMLRDAVVNSHINMARFSARFGCDHQKTNTGTRRPTGTTQEDLKNIALTLGQIGKRCKEEIGIRFGIHPHLNDQIQTEQEIDYILENTDPDHVYIVLDTGHISMSGMDPIALAKKIGLRVCEFHLKDVRKEDRGGTKHVPGPDVNLMNDPYFYPLGEGGVDFPALIAHCRNINWKGCMTVELDTSPWRPAKASTQITYNYIRDVLKLEF